MRMKFIKQASAFIKVYQLGSYSVNVRQDQPKKPVLYRYHAKSGYAPDIIWVDGELKIQQDVHWGAVNVHQAEAIIEGYKEAIEVLEFMGRFLK